MNSSYKTICKALGATMLAKNEDYHRFERTYKERKPTAQGLPPEYLTTPVTRNKKPRTLKAPDGWTLEGSSSADTLPPNLTLLAVSHDQTRGTKRKRSQQFDVENRETNHPPRGETHLGQVSISHGEYQNWGDAPGSVLRGSDHSVSPISTAIAGDSLGTLGGSSNLDQLLQAANTIEGTNADSSISSAFTVMGDRDAMLSTSLDTSPWGRGQSILTDFDVSGEQESFIIYDLI